MFIITNLKERVHCSFQTWTKVLCTYRQLRMSPNTVEQRQDFVYQCAVLKCLRSSCVEFRDSTVTFSFVSFSGVSLGSSNGLVPSNTTLHFSYLLFEASPSYSEQFAMVPWRRFGYQKWWQLLWFNDRTTKVDTFWRYFAQKMVEVDVNGSLQRLAFKKKRLLYPSVIVRSKGVVSLCPTIGVESSARSFVRLAQSLRRVTFTRPGLG